MYVIVFTVFFFIAAFAIEDWLFPRLFSHISFSVKTNRRLAECDEPVEIESTLKNTGNLPVNYVSITEQFPAGDTKLLSSDLSSEQVVNLDFLGKNPDNAFSAVYSMYMRPHSVRTVKRKVSFGKRGRYIFHGAAITRGDFLGITEHTRQFDTFVETVVLPKHAALGRLPDLVSGLLGDISVRRFIHEDPVLTVGYREYTGREPMKTISWTQSAKAGQLIVKKYDHTTDFTVAVLLNTECKTGRFGQRTNEQTENIEYTLSLARSVFEYLDEKRIPYSYTTNASLHGGRRIRLSMRSGFGRTHLLSVLENLGRCGYDTIGTFPDMMRGIQNERHTNTAFIVITAEENEEFLAQTRLLSRHCDVLILNADKLRKEDSAYAEQ